MKPSRILREFRDGIITKADLEAKGDFALADLTAGGLLNPTQQNTFFEMLNNYPALMNKTRKVIMPSPKHEISKIGFASRAFHVAQSGVALTEAQRSKPTTGLLTLSSTKIMAQFDLPYEALEDNIERGQLETTLLRMFADRLALDTEEIGLLGDPASVDPDLAAFTGYLKRITSHITDCDDTGVHPDSFNAAILSIPMKYRRDMSKFRFFVTPNMIQNWKNTIVQRPTLMGDMALQGNVEAQAHGVPMIGVPMMPAGKGILTQPENLLIGVQRELTLEADRDIEKQIFKFVCSARVDFQIEEEDMTTAMINLGS